mgnify:CR=1 FL=1
MGQIGGSIGIILGIILLLGAAIAMIDAADLQQQHDDYCGGLGEALFDWDGNCEELRDYIAQLQAGGLIGGACGLIFLIMGIIELATAGKSGTETQTSVMFVPQTSTYQQVQKTPHVTGGLGFCPHCGGPISSAVGKFCNNCGKPLA